MPEATVRCVANEGDGNRNVIRFEPTYQADEDDQVVANVTLMVVKRDEDTDAGEGYEVGQTYTVNISPGGRRFGAGADPHQQAADLAAQAKSIPNATNTRHYKTPAELKVPPVAVPDGVVTEPRPSVVLEPVSDVPATAGVTSAAGNPGPESQPANTGGTPSSGSTGRGRG